MPPAAASPPSVSSLFHELRQPLALNHFKKAVLGARHRPGEPQAKMVTEAFSKVGMEDGVDERTWRNWFKEPGRRARGDTVEKLDRYIALEKRLSRPTAVAPRARSATFYVDLIEGGLVGELLARTDAKVPIRALQDRTFDYESVSSWHLHLDAIECAALRYQGGEVACDKLKAIAAKRVLDLIYDRWNPGQGAIYKELPSSLKIRWNRSDDEATAEIVRSFARLIPNRFDVEMNEVPSPSWGGIGVSEDFAVSDIHKVLVLTAADHSFLVGDRFDAWVLDLVSANIAAYALAQTNPHCWEPFGLSPTCKCWDAMRQLFFFDELDPHFEEELEHVFSLAGGSFSLDVQKNLYIARTKYRGWLESLGLSARKICEMAQFEPLYPRVFVGGSALGPHPS